MQVASKAHLAKGNQTTNTITMKILKRLQFVREEIAEIPGIDEKPTDGIKTFLTRITYALSLGLKEKEIFFFGLLQWVSIALAYLLWVQMLDWIPESVWESAANSSEASVVDLILGIWSFFCVGVASFPVGIFTGCMGAAHFLHRQGRESTVATCLKFVLPQSWPLWLFHWIDGWITTIQIVERLPKKDDYRSPIEIAAREALYYAWKLGSAGMLPSILTGNELIASGKNSIGFVKENFKHIAALRAGYSALCWIVGIGAYVGAIGLLLLVDIFPDGNEVYSHIYDFYLWMAVPIVIALSVVMLLLRPIYVLAMCDLYSDYLESKEVSPRLPDDVSKGRSALVVFGLTVIALGVVYLFRDELGITPLLATPYGD